MEEILNFVVEHYVWFLVISIMLIFSLIGYFVDFKRSKSTKYKINNTQEINLENITVKEDVALSDAIFKKTNIEDAPVNMNVETPTTTQTTTVDNTQVQP